MIEMKQELFRNHQIQLRQIYTERTKDVNGKPLEFSKVVWFNFGIGEVVNGVIQKLEHPQEV